MNISQRGTGNLNLLKSIQQASKQISQQTGLAESMRIFPETPKIDESKLGAAASLGLNQKYSIPEQQQKQLNEMFGGTTDSNLVSNNIKAVSPGFDFTKSALQRLIGDIDNLAYTKEYACAIQSMFSLYIMGNLNENVLDRISRKDLKEIKGILKEFSDIIDSY